jgi:hypothetical protein
MDTNSSQKLMTVSKFIDEHITPLNSRIVDSGVVGYIAQHQFFDQVPCMRGDIIVPDYCSCLTGADEDLLLTEDASDRVASATDQNGGCDEQVFSAGFSETISKRVRIESLAFQSDKSHEEDVMIQLWFGSSFTMSPLHHDPYHNLLAQLCGYKYVRLYPVDQSHLLYPIQGLFYNNRYLNRSVQTLCLYTCAALWTLPTLESNLTLFFRGLAIMRYCPYPVYINSF